MLRNENEDDPLLQDDGEKKCDQYMLYSPGYHLYTPTMSKMNLALACAHHFSRSFSDLHSPLHLVSCFICSAPFVHSSYINVKHFTIVNIAFHLPLIRPFEYFISAAPGEDILVQ